MHDIVPGKRVDDVEFILATIAACHCDLLFFQRWSFRSHAAAAPTTPYPISPRPLRVLEQTQSFPGLSSRFVKTMSLFDIDGVAKPLNVNFFESAALLFAQLCLPVLPRASTSFHQLDGRVKLCQRHHDVACVL